MKTQIYQIKKDRKWETVRATSMKAISNYCKDNYYSDWRMVGMMSRTEMISNKDLKIVA